MDNVIRVTWELGFEQHHTGTTMLQQAARWALEQPDGYRIRMTKEVYPALARATGTSPEQVERSMRYAVKAAGHSWTNGEALCRIRDLSRRG